MSARSPAPPGPARVAFLGPEGTFTAEAARRVAPDAVPHPLPTIPDVFEAVRSDDAALGVVPLENLLEGSVNATLDEFAFGKDGVFLRGEMLLPVAMHLLGLPGTAPGDVRVVVSHPHALAQCRGWLTANLPDAQMQAATSTAEAARHLAAGDDGAAAAIGTALAAKRYGLSVLASDIHDHPGNTTRFGVLGRRMAAPTGADKTSIVVFFGEDRPGLLLRILDEFALRGINLSKIESRPAKTTLGEYCIFIDCDGHPSEPRIAESLRSVHRHVADLRVLGAYPRADGVVPRTEPTESPGAYAEAASWYDGLLANIDPGGR